MYEVVLDRSNQYHVLISTCIVLLSLYSSSATLRGFSITMGFSAMCFPHCRSGCVFSYS